MAIESKTRDGALEVAKAAAARRKKPHFVFFEVDAKVYSVTPSWDRPSLGVLCYIVTPDGEKFENSFYRACE